MPTPDAIVPGTAIVRRPPVKQTGFGITDFLERASALGLGAAGIAVRTTTEAIGRLAGDPDRAHLPPTPLGHLLHTMPGLALSSAYAARHVFLRVSGGVEQATASFVSSFARTGPLGAPIEMAAVSIDEINRWAFGEQQYNELLVQDFVRRSAPEVAESLVARIDLPNVVRQIPMQQIASEIDVQAILAEININGIIADIDIRPIADQVLDEIDIPGIIRSTTGSLTGELINANRVVFMHVDDGIAKVADTVIRPRHRRQTHLDGYDPTVVEDRPGFDQRPGGSERTDHRAKVVPADAISSDYARDLQGFRAGFASRALATGIDLLTVLALTFLMSVIVGFLNFLFTADAFSLPRFTWSASVSITVLIALIYYTASWTTTGRTVGDAILGLRVVTSAGRRVRVLRALIRAVVVVAIGSPCLLWCIVSKKNDALYDLPLKTTVLYDWTIN